MKIKAKFLGYVAGIMTGAILVIFSLQFVHAWVEPNAGAPNANIGAPLTTGGATQNKAGQLNVTGGGAYGSGGLGFGFHSLNSNSNGWLYLGDQWGNVYGGRGIASESLWASGTSYASTFSDSNDGNYYVNPNGTSRMDYGVFNNFYSYGWMQAAWYPDANDNNYYMDPNGTSRMNYGVFNNIYAGGWIQATWYPDANDNNYYVDPNGTSSLATVYANDVYLRNVGRWASQGVGDNLGNHSATTTLNMNWNAIVNVGNITATSITDANNGGYYVDPNNTSRMNYGVYDNLYSYGWMQSSVYYDANNTGFYIDPNGTSRVNTISFPDGSSQSSAYAKGGVYGYCNPGDSVASSDVIAPAYAYNPDRWTTSCTCPGGFVFKGGLYSGFDINGTPVFAAGHCVKL
jgi:hypothetical protein